MSTPEQRASTERTSAIRSIKLVAGREISTRIRTKSFVIATAVVLALTIIAIVVASIFIGKDEPTKVALVGNQQSMSQTLTAVGSASGTDIEVVSYPDPSAAKKAVADGDAEAALIPDKGSSYIAATEDDLSSDLEGVLRSAVTQHAVSTALANSGIDLAKVTADAKLTVEKSKPTTPDQGQRIAIALAGIMLLTVAIATGGGMVSSGVVEEKQSRIVEILLATIRPLHLLWGKIIGVGAMALGQVVLIGGAALITATATGLITLQSTAISMFLAVLVWFVLGFLFFATLYAAAGALVSRQEELAGTSAPLGVLMMASMYAGFFGINSVDDTWSKVLAWIPPFSAVQMPLRIAVGATSTFQVIATLVIMVLTCIAASIIASRIYQRSVLRTGSKVRLRDALSRK